VRIACSCRFRRLFACAASDGGSGHRHDDPAAGDANADGNGDVGADDDPIGHRAALDHGDTSIRDDADCHTDGDACADGST
jgi:hypothetical protein